MEPTLKQLLQQDFGIDLPISGGFGNSMENAVVIDNTPDYVDIEYAIMRCICTGRGVAWKMLSQALLQGEGGRQYDMLRIETKWNEAEETITQIERYYFDITANMMN